MMSFILLLPVRNAYGVVGQAQRYDRFKKQNITEFQDKLIEEEKMSNLNVMDPIEHLRSKEEKIQSAPPEEREQLQQDIEMLRSQLLEIPTRDRFQIQLQGDYQYESNRNRRPIHQEEGDTILNVESRVLVDLSGKKTDLRFEFGGEKNWNIIFSENDSWQVEERLRYRRKQFKKLLQSTNSRITRNQSKTIDIDSDKIRWDFHNQTSFNLPFSRKLSFNLDMSQRKRLFLQEAFDQDSGWQVQFAPTAFWNMTAKSRIQLGYIFGADRSRIKSGDANSHNLSWGYFGRVTRKSSISLDASYQYQDPRSNDTAIVRTLTTGIGYIWQATPKTQITTEVIRAVQNSTSNLTSGSVNGANTTVRQDAYFNSENLTVSLNSRLMKRLTVTLSLTATHTRNKTFKGGDEDIESRQFTFPTSIVLDYIIRDGINLNFAYSFAYRMGNEQDENNRAHTIRTVLRAIF